MSQTFSNAQDWVNMIKLKLIITLLISCLVYSSQCTPLTNDINEGRGIGSTIWGWITYPFTWWSSGSTEIPPETDHLTGPAPEQDIEIAKHNVTVWCNDQTCTTMRCDKYGCANITCNIYDTDLNGECRQYNTVKPEESTSISPAPGIHVTDTNPQVPSVTTEKPSETDHFEERPLELEAVLSSTVTKVDENDTKQ